MRAVPIAMVRMAAPTAAISCAKARGRVPCQPSKVTSVLRVFCSMKMMSTTRTKAVAHTASHAAPTRVCGTWVTVDVPVPTLRVPDGGVVLDGDVAGDVVADV